MWSLSTMLSNEIFVSTPYFLFSHACYMPSLHHHPFSNVPNDVWWKHLTRTVNFITNPLNDYLPSVATSLQHWTPWAWYTKFRVEHMDVDRFYGAYIPYYARINMVSIIIQFSDHVCAQFPVVQISTTLHFPRNKLKILHCYPVCSWQYENTVHT
jgi:hypothetical protein